MASVGPNYPSTGISLANAGTNENSNAWVSPGNVGSSSAVASITAASFDSPDIGEILVASGFGFSLAANDTITGITVEIRKRGYTSTNSGKDFRVQLATGTTFADLVGDNKASVNVWPQTTLATTTYGGTTDDWNAGLTATQLNSSSFAVFLSAYANVANADIDVDWIRVTVEYTPGPLTIAPSAIASAEAVPSPVVLKELGSLLEEMLADSPSMLLRGNESSGSTASDSSSGGTNDGTLQTGASFGGTALVASDTSIILDGATGHITVPDGTWIDRGDGAFTFAIVVARDVVEDGTLLDKGNDTTNGAPWLGFSSGGTWIGGGQGPSVIHTYSSVINNTSRHMYVMTYDGTNHVLYEDGVDITDSTANPTYADTDTSLFIGAATGGSTLNLDGRVAYIAYFPSAISASRVADWWAAIDNPPPAGSLTISPSAIASAETFGTATLLPGSVVVVASAITSAETIGTTAVLAGGLFITLSAINSAEVIGTVVLLPGGVIISPTTIDSAESIGSHVLDSGVPATPPLYILIRKHLPAPRVAASAIVGGITITLAPNTISPSAIISGQAIGSHTLLPSGVTIIPSAIVSAEVVGSHAILHGTVVIAPSEIASAEVVGSHTLLHGPVVIIPSAIATGEAFGSPTVSPGTATIVASAIASAEALGSPLLETEAEIIPSAIESAVGVGTPSVIAGGVIIIPTAIISGEAVGNHILTQPGGAQYIQPATIGSAEAIGTHNLVHGGVRILPGAIASGQSVSSPVLVQDQFIVPTSIGTAESVSTPVVSNLFAIRPVAIASGEASGSQTVLHGAVSIRPTPIASAEALGTAYIASGQSLIAPQGVVSGEAIGNHLLSAGNVPVVPVGISTSELFGLPTLVITRGPQEVLPAAITTAELFGLPELIPGNTFIYPSGIGSGEVFGNSRVAGAKTGWSWVNRSPAMAGTHSGEWPPLQDGFARPRKNEGESG